jgi:NADH-quinone oxidoreductase subunit D
MHICFLTIGGSVTSDLIVYLPFLQFSIFALLDLIELFSQNNRIVYLRLRGIGVSNFIDVGTCSISGVLARCTGMSYDLRIFNSYEIYFSFYFKVFISFYGDSMDRLLLRVSDVRNSANFFSQYQAIGNNNSLFLANNSIEGLIYIFYILWGLLSQKLVTMSIETPKGEYTVTVFTNNFSIYRVRIRCSDYIHLLQLETSIRGYLIGDLVALIGNIDCVFGSIDR